MSEIIEDANEAPVEVTEQADSLVDAPAVDSGTSEPSPEQALDAPFSLEDVDESYRSDVERYAKQLQGAYTRKTQALAEQRQEVESLAELRGELYSDDPEQRERALSRLLDDLGYEIGKDNEQTGEEYDEYVDPVDALTARLDAKEAEEANRQQEATEIQALQAQVGAAESALAAYEETNPLSETSRTAIVTFAGALPRLDDGLPDMASAIALWESDRAEAVEGYLKSKRDAEPAPDLSGSTGTNQVNLSDRAQRLQAAEAAAERAVARHA